MFCAYSSHARTSGSCMAVSRSAECIRNVSYARLKFSPSPVAMVELRIGWEGLAVPTSRRKISEFQSQAESCVCVCVGVSR